MIGSASLRVTGLLVVFACALVLLQGAEATCHMTASLGCFVDNDGPRVLNGYGSSCTVS
jgi:hypothetical protein